MARLLKQQSIYGFKYRGIRFDCGSKAGFQMANISHAMDRPEMRAQLEPFLKTIFC